MIALHQGANVELGRFSLRTGWPSINHKRTLVITSDGDDLAYSKI